MAQKHHHKSNRGNRNTSWNSVAEWYNGWMGKRGGKHHRKIAIPTTMRLLNIQAGMKILEIGAGQGVLAPHIAQAGGIYTGIEISDRLLHYAQKNHRKAGTFLLGDARKLKSHPDLQKESFDAVVFMMSIQDMEPLDQVLKSASWVLRAGGCIVLFILHPCFRVPRQSGWGWDKFRKLQYRRIDRYLTSLEMPMNPNLRHKQGRTLSFHRPLNRYINGLAQCSLLVERIEEIPTYEIIKPPEPNAKAINQANQEIPLFLGIRAYKLTS
ncbi:MAG: class I SAM-dependent methyltransferase [Chloroflexota bacterium]